MTAFHHVINGSSISGKFLKLSPGKWDAHSTNSPSDSIELGMESTYTKYEAEVMSHFVGRARQVRDVFSRLVRDGAVNRRALFVPPSERHETYTSL